MSTFDEFMFITELFNKFITIFHVVFNTLNFSFVTRYTRAEIRKCQARSLDCWLAYWNSHFRTLINTIFIEVEIYPVIFQGSEHNLQNLNNNNSWYQNIAADTPWNFVQGGLIPEMIQVCD